MKSKIFISLLIFALCFTFSPEIIAQKPVNFSNSGATVTNAGTTSIVLPTWNAAATGRFQVVNTKTSGTVAGTTYFEASVDGVNYITLDSLVNTNVTTNTKIFADNPPAYSYYRFRSVGSGTMVYVTRGYGVMKRN